MSTERERIEDNELVVATPHASVTSWHEHWRPPMPPPGAPHRTNWYVVAGIIVAVIVVRAVIASWDFDAGSNTSSRDTTSDFDFPTFTYEPGAPPEALPPSAALPEEVAPPILDEKVDFGAVNATYEPDGLLPPGSTLEPILPGAPGARAQIRLTNDAAHLRIENRGPGWVNVSADLSSPQYGRRTLIVPERGIPPGSAGLFRINGLGARDVRADDSGTELFLVVTPDATRPESRITIDALKSLRPSD